eukprot:TRINITY_DN153_c0_g2_i1.p1 TRINITY_DN153_c0_g2~~TRINITY_DN153_c0_g2_i1.p1  ORF type:complete len:556 (+),score=111.89 TRINITY_DN153_c0_g2_i1:162-1829(+)
MRPLRSVSRGLSAHVTLLAAITLTAQLELAYGALVPAIRGKAVPSALAPDAQETHAAQAVEEHPVLAKADAGASSPPASAAPQWWSLGGFALQRIFFWRGDQAHPQPQTSIDAVLARSRRSREEIWQRMQNLPDEETLWPYPAKVLAVVGMFVVFEYFFDFIAWLTCGAFWLRLPSLRNQAPRQSLMELQGSDEPGVLRKLSVLTLNVWVNQVRDNIERQIHSIRELAPDVICLQEVFHLDVLDAYRSGFPDYTLVAFGRAHNLSALVALLAIIFFVAGIFSGAVWAVETFITDTRWRMIWTIAVPVMMVLYSRLIRHHWTIAFLTGNRTGLVLLVRNDMIDIKEKQCVPYSRAGHAADLLNILRPRGFLSVSGSVRLPPGYNPLPVRLITTHLNQPLEQALGDGRHRQVKEVFHNCIHPGELLILGCDLNATPPGTRQGSDCNTYADVTQELSDAWAAVNPSDPQRDGLTWDQSVNKLTSSKLNQLLYGFDLIRWRCDYIFWRHDRNAQAEPAPEKGVQKDVTVNLRSCNMVFTGDQVVSDHFGVYACYDIRAA